MDKQDKELLLKDLCARLPYGVIAHYILFDEYSLIGRVYLLSDSGFYIKKTDKYSNDWTWNYETWTSCEEFDKFKLYLRPMSSMTKEEYDSLAYLHLLGNNAHSYRMDSSGFIFEEFKSYTLGLLDWLNANHFDYRGLIGKGLALEAPEGMYNV